MESRRTLTRFDWLVFFLSIYVVAELYFENIIDYPPAVSSVTETIDFAICLLFLGDFVVRFTKAPSRWNFLAWNWLDLLGSIPFVGPLRIARLARIARVLRLVRSGRVIFTMVHRNKAVSTFRTVFLLNIALVLLAAIAIYHVEHGEGPNFATIGDTIWWSLVAVTTLGFEGVTPVTVEGKVFALFLVVGGVLLFGTFIGMIADYFIGDEETLRELRALNVRLDRIEQALIRMSAGTATPGSPLAPPADVPDGRVGMGQGDEAGRTGVPR